MGFFEIFAGILAFFYSLIPSYGLAIILLTLTTRIVLLPLSIKQTRSMREMQVIQPEVKALQKKFKGDRAKLNEEMMKLYKEHGVNPLGGCLPLLLQLPVLFGLFYVIREPLKYLSESTSLAQDLQEKTLEVHQFLGFRLDCSPTLAWGNEPSSVVPDVSCGGDGIVSALPYLLLLALMGFTTWYQQRQMQASRGNDPQAQQMQMVGKIMPVFLIFIGFGFPAGVLLYWFTSNLWTIIQQRIILKAAPPLVGPAAVPATAKGVKAQASGKQKTAAKPASAKGNGAARPKSKPHPSSKKKKR
jgi:YidC/Oxa1 family membrane protein insertase